MFDDTIRPWKNFDFIDFCGLYRDKFYMSLAIIYSKEAGTDL